MITLMKALGEISFASGAVRATGGFNAAGEPVFEPISTTIVPGQFFTPPTAEEAAWLVEAGACRPAERGEAARAKAAEGEDPDEEEPLDPPMWARSGPVMSNTIDPDEDDA